MKQSRLIQMFLIVSVLLWAGCAQKASDEIGFGSVKNSVYQNEYFGLTVTLPSKWSVQDQESQQHLMKTGQKMLAGDDKNIKAAMKASEMQTVNLFAAFEQPIGSPVPFNANIICVAEQVRQMPGIKRGKDYLYHTKKLLESGQVAISFPSEITTESLGGRSFDVLQAEISMKGQKIRQKYYVAVMKDYALAFIVSFTTDEQESTLQGVLKSMSFK